jgi:hypothetical protein
VTGAACTYGGVIMGEDGPFRVGCSCQVACASFPAMPRPALGPAPDFGWTGPLDGDLDQAGNILAPPLPRDRWPYCLPEEHDPGCFLHQAGRFCDCSASATDPD